MNRSRFRERVAALRQRLTEMPQDAVWIVQPENRNYLSGFQAEDAQFTESSGSLLISGTQSILITDSRYTTEAQAESVDFLVKTLQGGFEDGFSKVVREMASRTLGFEEDYVTVGLHRRITDKLQEKSPPIRLEPLSGFVEEMRLVKDPDEVWAMEVSAELISNVLEEVIRGMRPGMTEKEVAWEIQGLAREGGAEGLAFPSIVASGPNGALPHAVPTDRRLKQGEPVILDVGVRVDGYCSDMTRTVFLGEPDPEFRKIYGIVRAAQQKAIGEIRPGVMSDQPDAVAREVIEKAGFGDYFGHALGHGVGLATHEAPRLSPVKPTELKKGMVVTVEPGIYLPGKGGVRLEEMVLLEPQGIRILTTNRHFYDFKENGNRA